MTGEKNRYSTVEKLWKLDDETLTTSEHDEMVLWLLDEKKVIKLFPELIGVPITIQSEVPILTNNKFIVGYWDVVISWDTRADLKIVWNERDCVPGYIFTKSSYFIEVKPSIKNFGSTLRQLKTYLTYLGYGINKKIWIFTNDTKFSEAFKSQGINIIRPLY